tara:strand:- start:172 stop:405 length:234 start_codon:yes stop_codon:yes gene_type:complete
MIETRLPVTVLSGFLGSVKITLFDHVLHNKDEFKVAVIVNKKYKGENYFYNSLGNALTLDSTTLESIKRLVCRRTIL